MNAAVGWVLAALAVVMGYVIYGWRGVALGVTMVAFWLLLQFSRTLRVLRAASHAPVGHVASAVMLNAKLHEGMSLPEVLRLTRSLGQRMSDTPEVWRWRDEGGAAVTLTFDRARLARWELSRGEPQ